MDFMMNKITALLDKFGSKIPQVNIPWEKLATYQQILDEYLSQANMIFPVDAILKILIIYGAFRAALLVIWVIKFMRDLLPF